MSYQESFGGRKTIPHSRSNHGAAENKPDVPGVEVTRVRNLSTFVPDRNGQSVTPVGLVDAAPTRSRDRFGNIINGTVVTPLVRQPLTPAFETGHGGKRVGGGGTSREALRRAKKKFKKSGKKL